MFSLNLWVPHTGEVVGEFVRFDGQTIRRPKLFNVLIVVESGAKSATA